MKQKGLKAEWGFFIYMGALIVGSALQAHEPEVQRVFGYPHAHENLEVQVHTTWESRYFSEGRDALDGDSLWATGFDAGWNHLTAGVWYGVSPEQSYNELQLSLGMTQSFGDFSVSAGYTHLRFPSDGAYDNELGLGLGWSNLPLDLELALDVYYSFDAQGAFSEVVLIKPVELTDGCDLYLSGVFGMNHGYVSDGHDGANHLALRAEFDCSLSEDCSLVLHGSYSWALDEDSGAPGDELLRDFFHGGVGLRWSF
ncbi:hypothetical protein HW115_06280 [Verrucomicrobiaceae bacterium N1E253]|uniref:Uncharacterized protein n=1 Tax=Oceaniferula marina TaxID=2748318 RepID=A0A851GDF8_9BACT|nr:hypothetical protein [Oceaniferula marina]NWK55209.1 hypothetical protein [Oceaniferula marina]